MSDSAMRETDKCITRGRRKQLAATAAIEEKQTRSTAAAKKAEESVKEVSAVHTLDKMMDKLQSPQQKV